MNPNAFAAAMQMDPMRLTDSQFYYLYTLVRQAERERGLEYKALDAKYQVALRIKRGQR